MKNAEFESLIRRFLKSYESKDLDDISRMLSDDVVLRDWNLEVVGKQAALREFAKNFEQAESLSIQINQIFTSTVGIAAEITIEVNGKESLRVVDILNLDESMKVTSIVSYKGL